MDRSSDETKTIIGLIVIVLAFVAVVILVFTGIFKLGNKIFVGEVITNEQVAEATKYSDTVTFVDAYIVSETTGGAVLSITDDVGVYNGSTTTTKFITVVNYNGEIIEMDNKDVYYKAKQYKGEGKVTGVFAKVNDKFYLTDVIFDTEDSNVKVSEE